MKANKSFAGVFALCMTAFIVAGILAAGPARAIDLRGLFEKKQPVMSLNEIFPIQTEDDFDGIAKSFHGTPYNDPEIEFEIMLPKDWTQMITPSGSGAYGPSQELISDLARFSSPVINTMRATVSIQAIKLPQEISAENWLKHYILSNKYTVDGVVAATSLKKASANCISTNLDGSSSYIYVAVQINGDNAIIIKFDSPLVLKEALAFVRQRIVDSFRFILETDQPIEALKSFTFTNALKFRYPASLDLNHVDTGDTRFMSIQFYNIARAGMMDKSKGKSISQIQGWFRFIVVKRSNSTSLKKETNDIKDFIKKAFSVEFKKLVSFDKPPVSSRFLFSRYEVYEVAEKKSNAIPKEIRFVALGDKNWYIFAILVTPSADENFYPWAVNTQDFDMMIKDFR